MLTETMLFGDTPTVTDFLSSEILVSIALIFFDSEVSTAVEVVICDGVANSNRSPVEFRLMITAVYSFVPA